MAGFAEHYKTTILPARAYKPRDKSLVEGAVKILYRRIYVHLSQKLRSIYNQNTLKSVAITKLAHWYNEVEKLYSKSFNTIMNTIKINYDSILNYFERRSTNAGAESFNAKIKAFRNQLRGVRKVDFL